MHKVKFRVLGLLFWLPIQWLALGIAVGGEGWIGPVWLSMFLLVLYPVAFTRAFCVETGPALPDRGLLFAAVVLDAFLLRDIILHEEVLRKGWRLPENRPVLVLWMALWAGWQLLALASLIRRRRFRIDPERS